IQVQYPKMHSILDITINIPLRQWNSEDKSRHPRFIEYANFLVGVADEIIIFFGLLAENMLCLYSGVWFLQSNSINCDYQLHKRVPRFRLKNTEYVPEPKKIKTHEKEKPSQNSSNDNMNTVSSKEKPSQNNPKVNMNIVSSSSTWIVTGQANYSSYQAMNRELKEKFEKDVKVVKTQDGLRYYATSEADFHLLKDITADEVKEELKELEYPIISNNDAGREIYNLNRLCLTVVAVEPYRPRAGMKHHLSYSSMGQQLFHNIQPLLNGLSTPMERLVKVIWLNKSQVFKVCDYGDIMGHILYIKNIAINRFRRSIREIRCISRSALRLP
ncbi:hypothetical protein L9F63_000348, partial [Diploptera punctata]